MVISVTVYPIDVWNLLHQLYFKHNELLPFFVKACYDILSRMQKFRTLKYRYEITPL